MSADNSEVWKEETGTPLLGDDEHWFAQILPGIVAVGFIIVVVTAVMAGERALMASARQTNLNTMQAVLTNTIQRFEAWADRQESDVRIWSNSELIQSALLSLQAVTETEALVNSDVQRELRSRLDPWIAGHGYRGFSLIGLDGTVLASMSDSELGQAAIALEGVDMGRLSETGVFLTHPSIVDLVETHYITSATSVSEEVMMHAVSPVRVSGERIGYMALRIDPMTEYSAAFRVGRTGLSGDTYAVNRSGRLLTSTRYEAELVEAGLIADGHPGMLHVDIRDPGVDLTRGGVSNAPYQSWPLTESARHVTGGHRGSNMTGYRDARGILVVGAWVWDDARDIGIITEIEMTEALAGAKQAAAVLRVFAVAMALSFILLAVLFSVHRNVTRQREQATYEAKQKLDKILQTTAEGIYGLSGDGVVTFVNARTCQILGYEEDELIGNNMHMMVHHSYRDGSLYPREECSIHTAGVPVEETDREVFWTKLGQPIPIEFSSLPLDPNDKSLGAVVSFRDISQRKKDETALRRYAQELKRSNSELQEFAYAASHDLQEPLRKIQAFGERLSAKHREVLDDSGRHYLDRMVDASTRMRRLIDDLLSYSRVNTKSTSFVPVDLSVVVADVISDLEPRISAEKAQIHVSDLPAIEADPSQMHQLFLNLLANGLKFHRSDVEPEITIRGSVEVGDTGAVAKITVSDNGIGFEPQHAERIFGMFERLHSREVYDGTGVGLATCRKIAERHSGELTAWGEPNAGAVFTLILPIRQANLG